jgi:hypothetical protein
MIGIGGKKKKKKKITREKCVHWCAVTARRVHLVFDVVVVDVDDFVDDDVVC